MTISKCLTPTTSGHQSPDSYMYWRTLIRQSVSFGTVVNTSLLLLGFSMASISRSAMMLVLEDLFECWGPLPCYLYHRNTFMFPLIWGLPPYCTLIAILLGITQCIRCCINVHILNAIRSSKYHSTLWTIICHWTPNRGGRGLARSNFWSNFPHSVSSP